MLEVKLAQCFQRELSLNRDFDVKYCNIRALEHVCILTTSNVSNKSVIYSTKVGFNLVICCPPPWVRGGKVRNVRWLKPEIYYLIHTTFESDPTSDRIDVLGFFFWSKKYIQKQELISSQTFCTFIFSDNWKRGIYSTSKYNSFLFPDNIDIKLAELLIYLLIEVLSLADVINIFYHVIWYQVICVHLFYRWFIYSVFHALTPIVIMERTWTVTHAWNTAESFPQTHESLKLSAADNWSESTLMHISNTRTDSPMTLLTFDLRWRGLLSDGVDSFSVCEVISCQCHCEGQKRLCWVTSEGGIVGGLGWTQQGKRTTV